MKTAENFSEEVIRKLQSRQNGNVTGSQGGFKLETGEIIAPDVAFTPKIFYRNLDSRQRTTFQGRPFGSVFVVVEVDDNLGDTTSFDSIPNSKHLLCSNYVC